MSVSNHDIPVTFIIYIQLYTKECSSNDSKFLILIFYEILQSKSDMAFGKNCGD